MFQRCTVCPSLSSFRVTRVFVLKRVCTVRINVVLVWCGDCWPSTLCQSVLNANCPADTAEKSSSMTLFRSVYFILPSYLFNIICIQYYTLLSYFVSYFLMYCFDCGKESAFIRLLYSQPHQQQCPRVPVQCPNRCGTPGITRETLMAHVKEGCSTAMVLCPFKEAGCKHRV